MKQKVKRSLAITTALMVAYMALSSGVHDRIRVAANAPGDRQIGVVEAFAADLSDTRLATAVVLYVGSSVAYVNNKETWIDPAPVAEGGRTYVPVRFVSENLNASVNWDGQNKVATIQYQDKNIIMAQNKAEMTVNGQPVALDAPVRNINGRIFVPLRALSQVMGKEIFYDRGLIIISDTKNIFESEKDKAFLDGLIARVNDLPTIGSVENFNELISSLVQNDGYMLYGEFDADRGTALTSQNSVKSVERAGDMMKAQTTAAESAVASADTASAATGSSSVSADYSKTNIQVEGVDEGDIIKTDGSYLYYANVQGISVVKAMPADSMKLVSTIRFSDMSFSPTEMYVDGNALIVLGGSYTAEDYSTASKNVRRTYTYVDSRMTKTFVYDITDKSNIKKVRELETSGGLLSSRKIGDSLYFVSGMNVYHGEWEANDDFLLPRYRDSIVKNDYVPVGWKSICYFPNPRETVFTTVTGVNLGKPEQAAQVYTYFGGGQNLYVSANNMYVASTSYGYSVDGSNEKTSLFKFSLHNGGVTYLYKASVPGRIINQFSMDENGRYFRIATTEHNNKGEMSNSMYVLDETLDIVGRLTDIAPTEQIYSVRFMGNRAYMVTFRLTDPLFTIDLADPTNPKILGALKIPGYSDYLHPYDENHLIGFGKDTMEQYGNAFYLGMKISMFDVTDVQNPKELFTEVIGGRGTQSPLLSNHRALLFSREKNLLAFPVEVTEPDPDDPMNYGSFAFQGAYVYGIDMSKGFNLKGKITHLSDTDMKKAGMYSGDQEKYIERILYIGDNLYSASQKKIMVNGITDMKQMGSVDIK